MTERNTRLLAAIMFTDIQGYTALMQDNEAAAVCLRDRHREVMDKFHKKHKGKIVQYYGDGSLSIFTSCVEAVKCAVSIQQELRNIKPEVPLRIGVHLGDIIERDDDIIGNGVNIASRVESLSVPGSVLISKKVADEITNQSEIQVKSMGYFSFKNASAPTEVMAIVEEGLVIPDGKLLEGKFTKRKSSEATLVERLPVWAKYLGGFVILSLLVPLFLQIFNPLGGWANQDTITLFDEQGQEVIFPLIQSKDIQRIYSASFTQVGQEKDQEWLSLGIPYALSMDWSQDPRMFNIFEEEIGTESLNRNLNKARSEKCNYLLQGTYSKNAIGYAITASVYNANNGELLDEVSYSHPAIFELLDSLSMGIKEVFNVSSSLRDVVELPIEQFLTNSEQAFQTFSEGVILRKKSPGNFNRINQLLTEALEYDSSFAWGHYYLSNFHNYHNISRPTALKHINLAMEYRDRMPENQNAEIRQLHYRINGKKKEALFLSEFLHKSRPNNAILLNNLIQEYYVQGEYEKTIESIEKFRQLQGEPSAMVGLMTECKIHLDKGGEAVDDLEKHLDKNPSDINAMVWLGKALLADDELKQAASSFEQVSVLDPENPEIPRLLEHVAFMRDSGEYISPSLFDRFQGDYWAEGMNFRSSHTIQHKNNNLYYQFEGALSRDIMYPIGKYTYFSKGTTYLFIPNENGRIDRMGISEGYNTVDYYLNYEVDEGILSALDFFDQEDYDSAEEQFKKSLTEHPQHIFLQYYLDHLNFRKSPEFQDQDQLTEQLLGKYSTENHMYQLFKEQDQFYIQSKSNTRYIDPIPLIALSPDTYLDTHKLTFRIQFIRENEDIALIFLNNFTQTVRARFIGK